MVWGLDTALPHEPDKDDRREPTSHKPLDKVSGLALVLRLVYRLEREPSFRWGLVLADLRGRFFQRELDMVLGLVRPLVLRRYDPPGLVLALLRSSLQEPEQAQVLPVEPELEQAARLLNDENDR